MDVAIAVEAPAYVIGLRPTPDGPLIFLGVRGTWDEVERLVQDIAARHLQVAFEPLVIMTVAEIRERYPDLVWAS
jgi:hypothetical protein